MMWAIGRATVQYMKIIIMMTAVGFIKVLKLGKVYYIYFSFQTNNFFTKIFRQNSIEIS